MLLKSLYLEYEKPIVIAASLVTLSLVFLLAIAIKVFLVKFKAGTTFGSASFGSWPGDLAKTIAKLPAGIVLGKDKNDNFASWSQEGHWLLVAPTGAGKSTGVLMPTIKNWQGHQIAIDIKGELCQTCAKDLKVQGVTCLRIDPFNVLDKTSQVESIGINPIDLAASAEDKVAAFKRLANVLIDPPGDNDTHWAESARVITAGLLAATSVASKPSNYGFAGLVALAFGGHASLKELIKKPWPKDIEPLVLKAERMLGQAGQNERGAILSTIRRQIDFLSSDKVLKVLAGSWDPAKLVSSGDPIALFVILPAERLETHARLLKLVCASVVESLLKAGVDRNRRLLLSIDEAAALGRFELIEQGIGLFRGYGATFLLAFQDEMQIEQAYGVKRATSIKANCNSAYWAMRELETCERVSKMIGGTTVLARSRDQARPGLGESGASTEREAARSLVTPDEIRRMPSDDVLCFVAGQKPVKLKLILPNLD